MVRKLSVLVLLTVLSAGLVSQSAVFADDEAPPVESTEVLDELSLGDLLTMEITTGSFLEPDLKKSPLSMTIINREMVRASGARHMSELLDIYVPGFIYTINKWNGTQWGMRGVSNDRNTKIIYLVNGHKLNTQTRDGFQSELVLGLLGDIERVEVLRGPAGLVYGTGAIAGIINVVTRKAEETGSEVTVSGGTDGSHSIEGNLFATPGDNQKLSVSAGFKESEGFPYFATRIYGTAGWPGAPGFRLGAPGDGRYGATPGNWKAALDWTWGEFNLYARVTHQIEEPHAFFILDPWPDLEGQPLWSGPDARSTVVDGHAVANDDSYWITTESWNEGLREYLSDNIMAEASYNLTLGENSVKFKVGFDGSTSRTQQVDHGPYDKLTDVYRGPKVAESFGDKRVQANTTYLLKSVPQLQAALGAEFRMDIFGEDLEGNNYQYYNDKKYVIDNINYYTGTVFGEGFYDINELLGAHLGLRLDVHSRAVMFNPKAALVFRPADEHSIKLIYQSASNNGTVDNYEYNRYHVDDNGKVNTKPQLSDPNIRPSQTDTTRPTFSIVQPAPPLAELHDLKPEKVHSVELAYVGRFMDALTVQPSFAWGKIMDLFGRTQDLYRVVNVGQYEYINADLEIKYSNHKITIGAMHTYQRPVRTDPDKESKTYKMYALRSKNGEWDSIVGYDADGDTLFQGFYTKSYETDLNVVKNSITYDGEHFMSNPDHISKFYAIYSPFEWMALSTSLRMIWGVPGMKKVIEDNDDESNYMGFYWELEDQSIKDFIMTSVSKKWNIGLSFYLPKQFDVSFYAYNILGTDHHSFSGTFDRNTVNTLRLSQGYELAQRDLYSVDQRSFGVTITKNF
jgi:outer membrane receptor protein involved in Fe transport